MTSNNNDHFTAQQAAAANTALRAALGLGPQQFGIEQFVGMISDEVEQLRAAGKTDSDIANVLSSSIGVTVDSADIARYYAPPEERGHP